MNDIWWAKSVSCCRANACIFWSNFQSFSTDFYSKVWSGTALCFLLLHHHPSNACCVGIRRWLGTCQQKKKKQNWITAQECRKKKKLVTTHQIWLKQAGSKRQERAAPAVRRKRQQKVSNIHTQSKHQTSSNTQNETLWSPWLHRKPASLENPPNVN